MPLLMERVRNLINGNLYEEEEMKEMKSPATLTACL